MNFHTLELFVLKCAVIEGNLRATLLPYDLELARAGALIEDERLQPFIKQFDMDTRRHAMRMANYYEVFYLLENDIRRLIVETLEAAHGPDWWETHVPSGVLTEVRHNRNREMQAGVSARSDNDIDYTTFGQLSDIIRENWVDFAGMLSNQSAVSRVLSGLNMLRGTIAHCGVLGEDEVDRLKLAIRDWFRVLEGPKT